MIAGAVLLFEAALGLWLAVGHGGATPGLATVERATPVTTVVGTRAIPRPIDVHSSGSAPTATSTRQSQQTVVVTQTPAGGAKISATPAVQASPPATGSSTADPADTPPAPAGSSGDGGGGSSSGGGQGHGGGQGEHAGGGSGQGSASGPGNGLVGGLLDTVLSLL